MKPFRGHHSLHPVSRNAPSWTNPRDWHHAPRYGTLEACFPSSSLHSSFRIQRRPKDPSPPPRGLPTPFVPRPWHGPTPTAWRLHHPRPTARPPHIPARRRTPMENQPTRRNLPGTASQIPTQRINPPKHPPPLAMLHRTTLPRQAIRLRARHMAPSPRQQGTGTRTAMKPPGMDPSRESMARTIPLPSAWSNAERSLAVPRGRCLRSPSTARCACLQA